MFIEVIWMANSLNQLKLEERKKLPWVGRFPDPEGLNDPDPDPDH